MSSILIGGFMYKYVYDCPKCGVKLHCNYTPPKEGILLACPNVKVCGTLITEYDEEKGKWRQYMRPFIFRRTDPSS